MLGKYILRHKLKNPTYVEDPNHQWFDIVDIFQNGNKNEIHLHGILKDENSVSTDNIEDNAVTASKTNFEIVGSAVQSINSNQIKITSGSIAVSDLSENARTTLTTVGVNSVSQDALKDNAVITSKINSLAVTTDKIANNAITTDKITNNAVTTNKIVNNAITTDKIINSAITTDKIANNAVTTAKIAAGAITQDKLNEEINWSGLLSTKLEDGSIPSSKINTQLFGVWISDRSQLNTETNTFNNLNSDWDENHCGIWVEI